MRFVVKLAPKTWQDVRSAAKSQHDITHYDDKEDKSISPPRPGKMFPLCTLQLATRQTVKKDTKTHFCDQECAIALFIHHQLLSLFFCQPTLAKRGVDGGCVDVRAGDADEGGGNGDNVNDDNDDRPKESNNKAQQPSPPECPSVMETANARTSSYLLMVRGVKGEGK